MRVQLRGSKDRSPEAQGMWESMINRSIEKAGVRSEGLK